MKQEKGKRIFRICIGSVVLVLCLSGGLLLFGRNIKWNQHDDASAKMDTFFDLEQNIENEEISAALNLLIENEEKNENKISVLAAEEVDFGVEDGHEIISFEDFLSGYEIGDTEIHYSIPDGKLSGDEFYVLSFKMRSKDAAAKVSVRFGDEEGYPYYLLTEWQTYYYPSISGNVIDSFDWKLETELQDGQQIFITDVSVCGYDKASTDPSMLPNGTYPLSHGRVVCLETSKVGTGIGRAMDLVGDGEYIYSINNGQMKVAQRGKNGKYEVVSRVKNLGTVRHIEWVNDNVVAVAARENGVWFIDVSDKKAPQIISCYDSLERANDVCFSGNLMFVAGRFYGVEIVDISDLKSPQFIRKVAEGKECYRCMIDQNYLVVSCWNTKSIEIYDLLADDGPNLVTTISVDGLCGEVFTENNILYVVTGYKAEIDCEKVGTAGYGTGNGLEIYDISDVSNPIWCSTVKADGSMKGSGYDDWSVEVSNGYAYFTDCFNGTYIYNVSNPYAPERVVRLVTLIGKDSSNYVDFTAKDNVVFPYDPAEYIVSPAMGIYLDDGDLYIGCVYSDTVRYSFDEAVYSKKEIPQADYNVKEEIRYQDEDITYVLEDYDVYAIDTFANWYIAGTDRGLILLDKKLVPCDFILTDHAVKGISITEDGYIITAEKIGVGIYKIGNGKIHQYSFINSEVYQSHVFSVGVTGDGNYAIVQSSWMKWEAINLHDKKNPVFVTQVVSEEGETIDVEKAESTGLMYYRSIVNGTVNGVVGIAGNRNVIWFKSMGNQLQICSVYKNNLYADVADSAALDGAELAVQTTAGGYIVYDPLQGAPDLSKLINYKIEGVSLQGIITTRLNKMSVCNPLSGKVWIVDISDYKNPILLKEFTVRGTPNAALICDDCILIPSRHDGLIRVEI